MPTDVRIQQVSCRLDNDQDPEMWVCDYRFQTLSNGEINVAQLENALDETPTEVVDAYAEDAEWTLV